MQKPLTAALLSLLFPGLGHFYLKKYADGVVILLITLFLWGVYFIKGYRFTYVAPVRRFIFWGGLGLLYFYALVDTYWKAKKQTS